MHTARSSSCLLGEGVYLMHAGDTQAPLPDVGPWSPPASQTPPPPPGCGLETPSHITKNYRQLWSFN